MKDKKELTRIPKSISNNHKIMQRTFGCCRYVYNHFLARRNEQYAADKTTLNYNACSACGAQWAGTKDLAVRSWVCPACGVQHDRDINAATNILNEGLRLLA